MDTIAAFKRLRASRRKSETAVEDFGQALDE
jgi:hypothetical protein